MSEKSALSEAIPQSLDELFSGDIRALIGEAGRGRRDAIVAELRRQRRAWAQLEAEGKAVPRSRGAKAAKAKVEVDYSDLQIDPLTLAPKAST